MGQVGLVLPPAGKLHVSGAGIKVRVVSVNGATSDPHTGMPAAPEAGAAGMLVTPVLGVESVAGGATGVPPESTTETEMVGAAVWIARWLAALHPTVIAAAISSSDVVAANLRADTRYLRFTARGSRPVRIERPPCAPAFHDLVVIVTEPLSQPLHRLAAACDPTRTVTGHRSASGTARSCRQSDNKGARTEDGASGTVPWLS